MVRYSDELIDEIKNSNDIVDVVSQYVTLKKRGRNFMGLCPFHKEKSPSFSVSPEKQMCHCFGCGQGGNVIGFVGKIENIGFRETIELLAERANITLPTDDNSGDDKISRLKDKVYQINKITAEFYHQNLYKPTSKLAQEYVKKRRLDNNTLKSFLIGYSGNFNELYLELKKNGFNEEEILASCLVNKTDDGKFIDRFRKRLMFPILDIRGRVIAFGGRVLDDSKPKYINSPENIVYSKSRHLFGLYNAKQSNTLKRIIIVEGYMDVISLHQRGITNVVASLGTAMTDMHGHLLRRYSEQVILGYDADGAGQQAIIRGLEILQDLGCDTRILQIDGAKDPDEFILKYGPDKFKYYVDNAISLVEYKIKNLKKELNLEVANDKIKFLKEIAKVISRVSNEIEQEVYIDKVAKEYNISREAILSEIEKLKYNETTKTIKILDKPMIQAKTKEQEENINKAIVKREALVIYLLFNYPEKAYERIRKNITLDDFKSEKNKKIAQKLYQELEKGNSNTMSIVDYFKDDEQITNYISYILVYDFEINEIEKCISDVIIAYEKEKLISYRNEIVKQLEDTSTLTNEEKANLEKNLSEVIIKLAKIK